MNPLTTDFDSATGESITRPMTDAEFANYTALKTAQAVAKTAAEKAVTDRAALLTRLGITDAEAKLL